MTIKKRLSQPLFYCFIRIPIGARFHISDSQRVDFTFDNLFISMQLERYRALCPFGYLLLNKVPFNIVQALGDAVIRITRTFILLNKEIF